MPTAQRKSKPGNKKRLTHAERHQRREKMADLVKSGKSLDTVARKFRVTTVTVRNACQEFGVDPATARLSAKKRTRKLSAGG